MLFTEILMLFRIYWQRIRFIWLLILALDDSSAKTEKSTLFRTPRIIGGTQTAKNEYPFMVFLSSDADVNSCGGSLIAPNIVLSAAHCRGEDTVHIGRHDTANETEFFETIDIEEEVIHPLYNSKTLDYDYMILKLRSSSSLSKTIISLDDGTISSNLKSGDMLRVIGWGDINIDPEEIPSQVLLEIDIAYLPKSKCESQYAKQGIGGITDRMICAQDPDMRKAACSGDSGGPLFIETDDGPIQVGIMSWSGEICLEDGPDVFALISDQIDWINEHIEAWTNDQPTPEVDIDTWLELVDDQFFNFTGDDDFFNFTDDVEQFVVVDDDEEEQIVTDAVQNMTSASEDSNSLDEESVIINETTSPAIIKNVFPLLYAPLTILFAVTCLF